MLVRSTGADVELMQLEMGSCRGDLLLLDLKPLELMRIRGNRSVLTIGPKDPARFQVGLSLTPIPDGSIGLRSQGTTLGEDMLFGLEPRSEGHLVTPGDYGIGLITMSRDYLFEQAQRLGFPDLERPLRWAGNWLQLEPVRLQALRSLLEELFLGGDPGLAADQARELVLRLLLESIVDGLGRREGEVRAPARIELVKQVEAWASQNPTVAIDLDTLAGRIYASRRSLVRGFRDHLGLGPISYLKLRRLHGVRRELLREHPEQARVHEVAAAWGFHSAGHFARDYRRLFGESPSATLQRGPEVQPEDAMEASSVSD